MDFGCYYVDEHNMQACYGYVCHLVYLQFPGHVLYQIPWGYVHQDLLIANNEIHAH